MKIMVQMRKAKPYILGLSIGTCWLISAATGFGIYSIANIDNHTALIAILVIAGTLLAVSVRQLVAALKLPGEPRSTELPRIRRWFALIAALQIVAIGLVIIACRFTGHLSWLQPLILIIIGIHFLPLAKLFGIPRYTTLGVLLCVVSILTFLLVPAHAHIGMANKRFVYSWLGSAASIWLISVGSLLELRRLLR